MALHRRTALRATAAVALGLIPVVGCDAPARRAAAVPSGAATDAGPGPSSAPASGPENLPAEVVNGPRDKPRVALTFHGQGDAVIAGRLLDELAAGGARVTVLAVGTWLDEQPGIARRILDGGHELGNHTQHHVAIAQLDAAKTFAEINECALALKRLTGSVGAWFRPSQTQHATPLIRQQAAKAGYPSCLSYDVDSLDYTDPGAAAVVRTTLGAVRNGSIVSLHFGHAGTVAAMPQILDGLRQRGLQAVSMTELMR